MLILDLWHEKLSQRIDWPTSFIRISSCQRIQDPWPASTINLDFLLTWTAVSNHSLFAKPIISFWRFKSPWRQEHLRFLRRPTSAGNERDRTELCRVPYWVNRLINCIAVVLVNDSTTRPSLDITVVILAEVSGLNGHATVGRSIKDDATCPWNRMEGWRWK